MPGTDGLGAAARGRSGRRARVRRQRADRRAAPRRRPAGRLDRRRRASGATSSTPWASAARASHADGRAALIAPLGGARTGCGSATSRARCCPGRPAPGPRGVPRLRRSGSAARAIGVVAHSGGGKTTTALQLALRGLDFMSDDVLVLEPDGDGVRAHPGIGLANVRPGADELLRALESAGLATPIGSQRRARPASRCAARARACPWPRCSSSTAHLEPRQLEVEHLKPVDPRILLAATFNLSVQTPERLTRQLDVCARVDRSRLRVQGELRQRRDPGRGGRRDPRAART